MAAKATGTLTGGTGTSTAITVHGNRKVRVHLIGGDHNVDIQSSIDGTNYVDRSTSIAAGTETVIDSGGPCLMRLNVNSGTVNTTYYIEATNAVT